MLYSVKRKIRLSGTSLIGLLGIFFLLGAAVALSENRQAIRLSVVLRAFLLQVTVAVLVIYVPMGQRALNAMARGVQKVVDYADTGTTFLFGELASDKFGFVVALKVLPVIVFVSSLVSILYYIGFMQIIIRMIGGALRWLIGVSRVEGLAAAANVFIGMVEAPLAVRPYLNSLNRSQFFAILAGGLSSVTGAMLLAYSSLGIDLSYLIAAAFMAAPGGLLIAKLLIPDDSKGQSNFDSGTLAHSYERPTNFVEAAADGASTGLKIALNVGAMLVAFVALLALANGLLSFFGERFGFDGITFEYVLGLAFSPLMFLLGIPWEDAVAAGNLVGQKTILNEFVAYLSFVEVRDTLSAHTQIIVTFALCGFANFSALGILMGGIASLLPERKSEIAVLGPKAVLAGTLSNLMSAAIAGVLFSLT